MAKKQFAVEVPEGEETTPFLYRVEEGAPEALTWAHAKAALRAWYLAQAARLRAYSEADFVKQEQLLLEGDKVEPVSNV